MTDSKHPAKSTAQTRKALSIEVKVTSRCNQ